VSVRRTVALIVVGVLVTGCGGSDDDDPGRLSAEERSRVDRSVQQVRSYCRLVSRFIARRGPAPRREDLGRAEEGADRLVAVARDNPKAAYRPQQSMRDLLGDTAENLEGTNCSGELVLRLRRGLSTVPAD